MTKVEPIPPFVSGKKLEELMSVNEHFLEGLRKTGEWQEGIHYVFAKPNTRNSPVKYVSSLCLNWLATRADPAKHELAKQLYLQSLENGDAGRSLYCICPISTLSDIAK